MKDALFAIFLLTGLVACSFNPETPYPTYTPRPITVPTLENLSSSRFVPFVRKKSAVEQVCVYIIQKDFAEQGYFADKLQQHIISSIKVTIDEHNVPTQALDIVASLTLAGWIPNEKGEAVGGYATPIEVCIPTQDLGSGPHTAFVSASSPSGAMFSYSWEFTIQP